VAPGASVLDPTVRLDGARPANTCVPPNFPWIRHKLMPSNTHQGGQGGASTTLKVTIGWLQWANTAA
jgi:hypothetical protein